MTSKDRVLTAFAGSEPDRVPIFANLTPQVGERLARALDLTVQLVMCGLPEAQKIPAPSSPDALSAMMQSVITGLLLS
mgnify:CR=1 FL=1